VQILVVVANVQARTLKTVVEKGFALTAIGRKLVGPERNGNTIRLKLEGYKLESNFIILGFLVFQFSTHLPSSKGNQVNIPGPEIMLVILNNEAVTRQA